MKVAFVFMHPFSESMGSVIRVKELAKSLGASGVEVYILTPYERSFEMFPNVRVVSMNSLLNAVGISKSIYSFSKLIYYSRLFPSIFSKGAQQSYGILTAVVAGISKFLIRHDVDIIQVEQDAALPIGIGLKKLTGLPLVVDIHNISSEELVANKILEKSSPQFISMQNKTKKYLSQVDHVIVVSESMRKYVLTNYNICSNKVSVVPPGGRSFHGERFMKKRTVCPHIVYAGLVAKREHVDLFAKSIPFVLKRNSSAQFFITDKGEEVATVKQLAKTLNIKPTFFWYEDYLEANSFLSSCDVGVLPSSNDEARLMGTPLKLFNYLSLGLPVVANAVGGWSEIIEDEEVGVIAEDNPRDFGEKITHLLAEPGLVEKYALNGLNLIKSKYNWDISAGTLISVYETYSSKKSFNVSVVSKDLFVERQNLSHSMVA